MTLSIRPCDERTFVLTDHRGVPLPGQVSVAWNHGGPGELGSITVELLVDGFDIVTAAEPLPLAVGYLPEALAAWGDLSEANRLRFLNAVGAVPGPLYGLGQAFGR